MSLRVFRQVGFRPRKLNQVLHSYECVPETTTFHSTHRSIRYPRRNLAGSSVLRNVIGLLLAEIHHLTPLVCYVILLPVMCIIDLEIDTSAMHLNPCIVIRSDPQCPDQYSAYNIETGTRYNLAPLTFLILHIAETSPTLLENIADTIASRGIQVESHKLIEGIRSLLEMNLLALGNSCPQRRRQFAPTVPPTYAVPVASSPIAIELHFTSVCNLRCSHCFISASNESKAGHLDYADWSRVFDQLEYARIHQIVVSGGEPLAHPESHRLIRNLSTRLFSTALLTNGTMIDQELAQTLSDPRFSVAVSLDGASEAVHDRLRGKGAFARTMDGISLLASRGVRFSFSTTLHAMNVDQMRPLTQLALDCGAESIGIIALDPVGRAAQNPSLHLTHAKMMRAFDECQVVQGEFSGRIAVHYLDPRTCATSDDAGSGQLISCAAGTTWSAIRSDGVLFPCVYAFDEPEFAVGSLLETELLPLWQHDRWGFFRGGISLSDLPDCRACSRAMECSIRNCRMRALFSGNGALGTPPGCRKNE